MLYRLPLFRTSDMAIPRTPSVSHNEGPKALQSWCYYALQNPTQLLASFLRGPQRPNSVQWIAPTS
jgi:hypothetical protein